jgi:LysE type translocator
MGFFDARFGSFLVVEALLIVTPGPDTALVTRHALLAGRRAASFATLGIGAGSILWALASVLGIAVLLERRDGCLHRLEARRGGIPGVSRPAQSDRYLQEDQASRRDDTYPPGEPPR